MKFGGAFDRLRQISSLLFGKVRGSHYLFDLVGVSRTVSGNQSDPLISIQVFQDGVRPEMASQIFLCRLNVVDGFVSAGVERFGQFRLRRPA